MWGSTQALIKTFSCANAVSNFREICSLLGPCLKHACHVKESSGRRWNLCSERVYGVIGVPRYNIYFVTSELPPAGPAWWWGPLQSASFHSVVCFMDILDCIALDGKAIKRIHSALFKLLIVDFVFCLSHGCECNQKRDRRNLFCSQHNQDFRV